MSKDIVIIGGGGHAKVIYDIIVHEAKYKVIGFTSSNKNNALETIPLLGSDSTLEALFKNGVKNAFIAIGDCQLRNKIFDNVQEMGFNMINAISPHSHISKTVTLGKGVAIMPGVSINTDSIIEDNVIINTNASVDHDNIVKKSSHIGPGSNLAGNVTVGKGAFLGIGTKVIPGTEIGDWCTIGAGSVVIRKIPSYTTALGVPCRVVKVNK